MSGGRTHDGGDIVGASVFYHEPPPDDETCGNKTSGRRKSDDPVSGVVVRRSNVYRIFSLKSQSLLLLFFAIDRD